MQAFDFTGKTVFVAGGTSGINLGIAEAFAKAGAKLDPKTVSMKLSDNYVYITVKSWVSQPTYGTLRLYRQR